jgi:hypothetical protein
MRTRLAILALGILLGTACSSPEAPHGEYAPPAPRPRRSVDFDVQCLPQFRLSPRERQACIDYLRARDAGGPAVASRYACPLQGPPRYKLLGCDQDVCVAVWTNVCDDIFFQIVDAADGVEMWLGPGGCTDCRP